MEANDVLLNKVAQEIFEQTAYLTPRPEGTPSMPKRPDAMARATVNFTGPFPGILQLEVPSDLLPILASNMLGEDETSPEAARQGQDALGELANIICGNLLARMAGPEPIFHLDAPTIENPARPVPDVPANKYRAYTTLSLEIGWASLSIALNPVETPA
ncbi:MAG: chemotaxis protein CheX [candidate division FCPU426 bacterium]